MTAYQQSRRALHAVAARLGLVKPQVGVASGLAFTPAPKPLKFPSPRLTGSKKQRVIALAHKIVALGTKPTAKVSAPKAEDSSLEAINRRYQARLAPLEAKLAVGPSANDAFILEGQKRELNKAWTVETRASRGKLKLD